MKCEDCKVESFCPVCGEFGEHRYVNTEMDGVMVKLLKCNSCYPEE